MTLTKFLSICQKLAQFLALILVAAGAAAHFFYVIIGFPVSIRALFAIVAIVIFFLGTMGAIINTSSSMELAVYAAGVTYAIIYLLGLIPAVESFATAKPVPVFIAIMASMCIAFILAHRKADLR